MKFGIRKFSLNKRISARTSVKRYVRHNIGIKVPKGFGIITNPKKAVYIKVYNKTTISFEKAVAYLIVGLIILVFLFVSH